MLALVPPENESPEIAERSVVELEAREVLVVAEVLRRGAAGSRGEAGSKIPWCWRMLGSWNRD